MKLLNRPMPPTLLRFSSIYINHDLNSAGRAWENRINVDDMMYTSIEILERDRGGEEHRQRLKQSHNRTWHQHTILDDKGVRYATVVVTIDSGFRFVHH